MEKTNIFNFRNAIMVGVLFAILILFYKCHNTEPAYSLDNSKVISNYDARISKLLDINAEIEKDKEVLKKDYDVLVKENETLKKSISDHRGIYQNKEAKVKSYSKSDIASYFESRYNLPLSVKTTANGTELNDTIAKATIKDLLSYDEIDYELSKTNEMLSNSQKQVNIKDSLWKSTEKQYANCLLASKEKDSISDFYKKNAEQNLKKANSESNKKNFWKITTGITTAVIVFMKVR